MTKPLPVLQDENRLTELRVDFPSLTNTNFTIIKIVEISSAGSQFPTHETMMLLEITNISKPVPFKNMENGKDGTTISTAVYSTICRGENPYKHLQYWSKTCQIPLPYHVTLTRETAKANGNQRYVLTGISE